MCSSVDVKRKAALKRRSLKKGSDCVAVVLPPRDRIAMYEFKIRRLGTRLRNEES